MISRIESDCGSVKSAGTVVTETDAGGGPADVSNIANGKPVNKAVGGAQDQEVDAANADAKLEEEIRRKFYSDCINMFRSMKFR